MAVNLDTNSLTTLEAIYASALIDLAAEANQLDEVANEVADLGKLLETEPGLQRLVDSRVLSIEERAGVIDRVFKGKVGDLLYRFLQVVNQKDRLSSLPDIIDAFGQLVETRRGIIRVDAYVASSMDESTANGVADRIGKSLGKTVKLTQHINEKLIGGLKIRIGDQVVDGSVETQLKLLKDKMLAAGRAKAREAAKAGI
jgi:F-type H+-transporting ATPase subunit delta